MKKQLQKHENLLNEQVAYYKAQVQEYNEWFLRQGRYDLREKWNEKWFADMAVEEKRGYTSIITERMSGLLWVSL